MLPDFDNRILVATQAVSTIDKVRTVLTLTSGGLLVLALFTTAQYRSATTNSTLVELAMGGALLVLREALRRFNENYFIGSGPVYNFRKDAPKAADTTTPPNPGVM